MFSFTGLPLCEHSGMFDQPQLILRVCCALIGEIGHGLPAADVILLAEVNHFQSLRQFTSPF